MDDLRLELRSRVGVMVRFREINQLTQAEAASIAGVSPQVWCGLEVLRIHAKSSGGDWKPSARAVAKAIGTEPEMVWTGGILEINEPRLVVDCDASELAQSIENALASRIEMLPPSAATDHRELVEATEEALSKLSPREESVIRMRFYDDCTLDECAERHGVGRERVRQIEAKALRKLRHPSCNLRLHNLVRA